MNCNKQSINPRPSCGHRHKSVGCPTSVCGQKTHHFGVEQKSCEVECVPFEPECPAVWTNPAPETIQEAIDRIAAATYFLLLDASITGIQQIGATGGSADIFFTCPPALP